MNPDDRDFEWTIGLDELAAATRSETCDVWWGSHGCELPRGHDGHHWCPCCTCADHANAPDDGCVGTYPYYGPNTILRRLP